MLNITKNQAADRHRLVWKNVFVFLVFLAVTVFCGGEPGVFASAAPIADNGFQYVHNPLENYKVVRDVDVAPETIYGFKPNSTGTLKAFATYDFTSAMKVSEWKAERTRYHEGAVIAAVYVALTLAFADPCADGNHWYWGDAVLRRSGIAAL